MSTKARKKKSKLPRWSDSPMHTKVEVLDFKSAFPDPSSGPSLSNVIIPFASVPLGRSREALLVDALSDAARCITRITEALSKSNLK